MDNRTKLCLRTVCLLSLAPAVAGLLLQTTELRAQSQSGKPAGPVGWYRPAAAHPDTSTTNQPSQQTPTGTTPPSTQTQGAPQNPGVVNGASTQPNNQIAPIGPSNQPSAPYPSYQPGPIPIPTNPSNPMLVVDPVNGGNNNTTYYDANGHIQMGRTTPETGLQDYRKSPFGEKKEPAQLQYFGYDYFKPAQELIEARRASLMPRNGPPTTAPLQQPQNGQNLGQPQPQNPQFGTQPPPFGSQPSSMQPNVGVTPTPYGIPGSTSGYQPGQMQGVPGSAVQGPGQAGLAAAPLIAGAAVDQSQLQGSTDQSQLQPANQPNATGNTYGQYGQMSPAAVTFGTGQPVATFGNGTNTAPQSNPYPQYTPQPAPQANTPGTQDQVDIYSGRVAGPLELMNFMPAGGAVPQTYQLSGGDTLTVRVWSTTMPAQEYTVPVSPTGYINLPNIGTFVVRGQTTEQAEHALRERISRLFRGGDISLMLKQQRTMVVTIAGSAFLPGSYLVPASQTAYNVLYAAGGPSLDGSMRSIEVRRMGALVGTLDLYDFLGVGGKASDIPLQPGDVIYIPSRYSSVALSGEVRKAAIYELRPNETLKDALHFAGGVKASGVTQHVQIDTVDPGSARVLRDINVKDATQVASTPLYDGDEVDVFSIRSDIANRVTVEGAVDQVGDYALAPGMTVADLINRARGTRYNAYMKRADLYRWNADDTLTLIPIDLDKAMSGDPADNLALTRWDRLKVYGRDELTWSAARQVRIRGAVQHEGIYYRSDNMHASDLMRMAGGPLPEAYLPRVVLLHQKTDGSFDYDYLDADTWATGDLTNDPVVQDNDILAVYRNDEAHFTADHLVRIDGEVVAPGSYARGEHMRVSDVLKLAGGFTPKAHTTVYITHPNAAIAKGSRNATPFSTTDQEIFDINSVPVGTDVEVRDGDVLTVQGDGDYHTHVRLVYIDGRVRRPGPIPMYTNMRLSDLVKAAGGLQPDAFVDGAEFHRNPDLLGSDAQQSVAKVVGSLNDLLNSTDYQRALAASDADRILFFALVVSLVLGVAIPGLGGSGAASASSGAAAAAAAAAAVKNERDPVTPPRQLADPELKPAGNLAVDVASALRHPGDDADVILDEGDTVTIPTQPTTVEVAGAVFNTRGVVFKPGAGLDYYISQAGGYAPDAARDRIEVIHAGGGLVPAGKVRRIRNGDMILVPTKVLAAKISSRRSTFDDVLKTGLGATVLLRLLGL